jgi:hypothetical protein
MIFGLLERFNGHEVHFLSEADNRSLTERFAQAPSGLETGQAGVVRRMVGQLRKCSTSAASPPEACRGASNQRNAMRIKANDRRACRTPRCASKLHGPNRCWVNPSPEAQRWLGWRLPSGGEFAEYRPFDAYKC